MRYLTSSIVTVVVLALFASPAAAQGFLRGGFEKWSGPGAFWGWKLQVTPLCYVRGEADSTTRGFVFLGQPRTTDPTTLCLDVGFGSYANDKDDRPEQGLVTFDQFLATVMFTPPNMSFIELGAGLGATRFHGRTFDFARATIPVTLVLKPGRLIDDYRTRSRSNRGALSGIVRLEYTGLILPNSIDNNDLNIDNQSFNHWFLTPGGRIGVMVDASSFLFNR